MPKLRVLLYFVDIGDLYTGKIENLETLQVPNNYSAGCSLHGDVATQGIFLVGAHSINQSDLVDQSVKTLTAGTWNIYLFKLLFKLGKNHSKLFV